MNIMNDWPFQFIWAMRKGGGGGGGDGTRTITIRETPEEDIQNVSIDNAATTWTVTNNTNYPMFVQTFDEDGNEMRGDVSGRD